MASPTTQDFFFSVLVAAGMSASIAEIVKHGLNKVYARDSRPHLQLQSVSERKKPPKTPFFGRLQKKINQKNRCYSSRIKYRSITVVFEEPLLGTAAAGGQDPLSPRSFRAHILLYITLALLFKSPY